MMFNMELILNKFQIMLLTIRGFIAKVKKQ